MELNKHDTMEAIHDGVLDALELSRDDIYAAIKDGAKEAFTDRYNRASNKGEI